MPNYRIKILSVSIKTDIRLFDVQATHTSDAVRKGASVIFGLDESDFEFVKTSGFFSLYPRFEVAHKRMKLLSGEIEVIKT